ncbi:MAG: hypothetical protein ACI8ZN_002255 [Bacteroidia bacterium]|jgi:hypothetical protein
MRIEGNIRKMKVAQGETVQYGLRLFDILDPTHPIPLNEAVGKEIKIEFLHAIHCTVTGKKIKKTFGDGMSYDAFMNAPEASPSIIRPELSRIHEGVALRDFEWEMKNHMTPHTVYLAQTAGVKVGVTRNTQIPTRWMDQGAVQAIILATTPYRQVAGLIEVALKDHISDKTAWQRMLKGEFDEADLQQVKDDISQYVPDHLNQYINPDKHIESFKYPILANPKTVKSIKLDKVPYMEKKLMGIKGQYLIFDDCTVMNMRSHSGYRVVVEW